MMKVDGAYDLGLKDLLYLGPSGIFEERILDLVSTTLLLFVRRWKLTPSTIAAWITPFTCRVADSFSTAEARAF